jgi:ribulose-5-phosphate 4-epimerase/fuculose-1-phosphate aldolase
MSTAGSPHASDYLRMASIAQLRYYYVVNPASPYGDWAVREIIEPAFRALHAEFGITVEAMAYGEVPARRFEGITYVLYGPTNPLAMSPDEQAYLASLAAAGNRTNIISAYPLTDTGADRPEYSRAKTVVPQLCDALDINAIYPDDLNLAVGIRTNTRQDVYLNAIGETIRIKYQPTESLDADDRAARHRLRREHHRDIAELARLHRENHLWQRRPYTDGSIMFTHDGHWLVSQTLTDKARMTSDDYDLISSFDEGRSSVTYTGPRLPSSDAPEFLLLSSLLSMHARRPRLIVHFHHRELTRGPHHRELVTDDRIEGGRFATGRLYFREMRRKATNWFIVREHGMVWTGDSVAEFDDYIRRVVSR